MSTTPNRRTRSTQVIGRAVPSDRRTNPCVMRRSPLQHLDRALAIPPLQHGVDVVTVTPDVEVLGLVPLMHLGLRVGGRRRADRLRRI